jgi:uncharacterized protein (TIGR04255 family)
MTPSDIFDSIHYSKNFLTGVIARIDLVSPVLIIAKELPKDVSKVALKYFPIDEPKPAFTQEIVVTPKEVSTSKQEFTEWNFYGRNREKHFRITPAFFFISYKKYEAYEGLRNEFIEIVGEVFRTTDQAQPSRLGLRYINEINLTDGNPLDWKEYIDSSLLGLFSYSVEDAQPTRIFHNIELVFGDFNLRVQFGIHNPDYLAPIRRRIFILDYDAYYRGPVEPTDVPILLDKSHFTIQKMFESNITQKLREIINE